MIRSRLVAARATRSALIAASVPEFTKRTRSSDGISFLTRSASATSSGLGAPKLVPSFAAGASGTSVRGRTFRAIDHDDGKLRSLGVEREAQLLGQRGEQTGAVGGRWIGGIAEGRRILDLKIVSACQAGAVDDDTADDRISRKVAGDLRRGHALPRNRAADRADATPAIRIDDGQWCGIRA